MIENLIESETWDEVVFELFTTPDGARYTVRDLDPDDAAGVVGIVQGPLAAVTARYRRDVALARRMAGA